MGNKEILTLQFGHYANFVGAHWWNIQEQGFDYNSSSEINNDTLYREGLTDKNEVTFTPRLLLVDLKGSLKSLPERGDLYDSNLKCTKDGIEWDPNLVDIENEPSSSKNKFLEDLEDPRKSKRVFQESYELEKDVSVWSDFLYSRFHPRTVNIIKEYQHCNENTPFDIFPLGNCLWKSSQFQDEFSDKIRNYIEECDNFEGFQILTDCTNAFSGLSASCLEHLQDDYDRKSVLVLPVIPSAFPENNSGTKDQESQRIINDSIRVLNLALSFNSYSIYSSLFVPLSTGHTGWRKPGQKREFYHTVYDHELPYHSSAILASALDTVTMKYRLKSNNNFSLMDLCVDLSPNGRKAAAASLCLPFSINDDSDLLECLDNWQGPLSQSITPNCKIGSESVRQYIFLRGIKEENLKQPPNRAQKQCNLPAYKCNSITEMLNLYLSYSTLDTVNNVTVLQKPLDVKTPYPRIFDEFIGQNGVVCANPRAQNINVQSVPILAGLHSGSGVGEMIESLHTEARRIKFAKFHQFIDSGIEKDEFEDCLDNLFTLRENYTDNSFI